jgi:hypothetical protein
MRGVRRLPWGKVSFDKAVSAGIENAYDDNVGRRIHELLQRHLD